MKSSSIVIGVFMKNWLTLPVKTRLARSVGHDIAVELYCNMLQVLVDTLKQLSGVRVIWCVAGGWDQLDNFMGKDLQFCDQIEGDLGQKMNAFFNYQFSIGASSVIVIGSDCLYLNSLDFEKAFQELKTNRLVFQPSNDGGYTLVGMNRPTPQIFKSMPWSKESLMQTTLKKVDECNFSYASLPERRDIDTLHDFNAWCDEHRELIFSDDRFFNFSRIYSKTKTECI